MSTMGTDVGMTGLLSGSGHDQLRVTVLTGHIPDHAPVELEGSVTPIYDDEGHLCDWRLDPAHADHNLQAEDFKRFAAWRGGFATERFLGERGLILSFLNWADQQCDVSKLRVLRLDHVHLDDRHTLELDRQLGQIQHYVEHHPATGYGLFSGAATRPIRGIIPSEQPTTVLALGSDQVTVETDGLHLHTGGADHLVTSWEVSGGEVTANGELAFGREVPGRLLRIVGRQAPSITVQSCPVRSLMAPLLNFGKEAAELAKTGHTGLDIRSSWS